MTAAAVNTQATKSLPLRSVWSYPYCFHSPENVLCTSFFAVHSSPSPVPSDSCSYEEANPFFIWANLSWCLHKVITVPDTFSFSLAHEEGPEVARPPVHLHGAGIADGDEEAVSRLKEGGTGLMQGEETRLLPPRPAGTPGRFHQQDGDGVGTHLWATHHKINIYEHLTVICY